MPSLRLRVRTLLVAVAAVALLLWGTMMASRSYDYRRRALQYGAQEQAWQQIAIRSNDPGMAVFHGECIRYFAGLSTKYRQAMWRPWRSVAPDPHAPGYDQWLEQERRARPATREISPRASARSHPQAVS